MLCIPTIALSYYYPLPSHTGEGKSIFSTGEKKEYLTPTSFLSCIKYKEKCLCLKVFFLFHPNS